MKRLMQNSNIFIQNFTPKVIEKLKLDYESVKLQNPKLIYASVTGYPHNSNMKDTTAFDLTI